MASIQALSAAAQDRKARLAQLKSLKRKQPDSNDQEPDAPQLSSNTPEASDGAENAQGAERFLSGRNYDVETRNAKLGFEEAPSDGKNTLEKQAAELAIQVKEQASKEEKDDAPLDLFKIQPKKPNWDLKRDLDRKMEILSVRTDNAIARLVRERITQNRKAAKTPAAGSAESQGGEAAGIDGAALVEAANIRERENEEDTRREREEEEALLDGS